MNIKGLIIWGVIVLIAIVFCFFLYKILTKDWYSNRKSEVKIGLISCLFSVAFFLFAPLVTIGKNIDFIAEKLGELINQGNDFAVSSGYVSDGLDNEAISALSKKLSLAIRSFIHFPDISSPKIQITIASIAAIVIVVIIAIMIYLIKEQKKEFVSKDERKHLFEIQESYYNELTKKRG